MTSIIDTFYKNQQKAQKSDYYKNRSETMETLKGRRKVLKDVTVRHRIMCKRALKHRAIEEIIYKDYAQAIKTGYGLRYRLLHDSESLHALALKYGYQASLQSFILNLQKTLKKHYI